MMAEPIFHRNSTKGAIQRSVHRQLAIQALEDAVYMSAGRHTKDAEGVIKCLTFAKENIDKILADLRARAFEPPLPTLPQNCPRQIDPAGTTVPGKE